MIIPLTLHDLKLFAPVTLDGKPMYAQLDTGASLCHLTALAAEGLNVGGAATLMGALGAVETAKVRIPRLEFLGETFHDVEALADLAHSRAFETIPFEVALTLDASTILARPLTLNFKTHHLEVAQGPFHAELATAPLDFVKELPFVSFRLGGRELRGIFDLGAGFSVLNAARREALAPDARFAYELEVNDSVGHTSTTGVWQRSGLSLGEGELGVCEFLLMDLTALEEKMNTAIDFIFGVNTMISSARVWLIDAAGGRLGFARHGMRVTR